jgi:hypothetical protein
MNHNYKRALHTLSNGYEGRMPENYEGRMPSHYSGGFNYDGQEEEASFADEAQMAQNLTFAFTIDNTVDTEKGQDFILALCPGYFEFGMTEQMRDNNNQAVDSVIHEGEVHSQIYDNFLVVKSQNKPINELICFTRFNPMRFVGIKMQCSNPDQFYQSMHIKQLSPFRNLNDYTLTPDNYKDSRQMDVTRVEIPLENFQFDNNTLITWKILKGTVVSLTLFGGAVLNMARQLDSMARTQRKGLSRSYGPDYLRHQ